MPFNEKMKKEAQEITGKIIGNGRYLLNWKVEKSKLKVLLKSLSVILLVCFFAAGIIYGIYYYKSNFTPSSILERAVKNMLSAGGVNYKINSKVVFSYKGDEQKLNVSESEIYTVLKSSVSDSHEIKVIGNHYWQEGRVFGRFNLDWSVTDKEIFTLAGFYQDNKLSYKINPLIYSDLVDAKYKNNYSEINLRDLFSGTVNVSDRNLLANIKKDDLIVNVTDVYQDDLFGGRPARHYKVSISGKGGMEDLLRKLNLKDFDIWINKEEDKFEKIKGEINLENVGADGNSLAVQFEINFY